MRRTCNGGDGVITCTCSIPPDARPVETILASIPGREEKSGLVYFVCACAK